ncbi:GxxExxY protein [Candidatus Curtissbacteria bacterium]|nr:GxxExxY protein [Candidatus Curtissbacteria bacterium]
MRTNNKRIIYPRLSYQVMSVLFKVHNKLGSTYQEKYYQRAIKSEFQRLNIPFEREKQIKLVYEDEKIGDYFLDFLIDNKIILEIKAVPFSRAEWINQVVAYLSSTGYYLAIIANFRTVKLTFKRIVNPNLGNRELGG